MKRDNGKTVYGPNGQSRPLDMVRMGVLGMGLILLAACGQGPDSPADTSAPASTSIAVNTSFDEGAALLYGAETRFDYPRAVELLEAAVAEDETNAAAKVALTYAYLKRSNYAGAAEQAQAASALADPLSAKDALLLAAYKAQIADDGAGTIAAWQNLVSLHPDDRWGWYELASAHAAVEEYGPAASASQSALAIEPDPAKWSASWIYYLHSKALFRDGRPAEAADAAEAGKDIAATWRATYFRMALGQVASGAETDTAAIAAEYEAIATRDAQISPVVINANIALFFFELGDFETAAKYAQIAYDIEPQAYPSWALGYSLTEAGDPNAALEILAPAAEEFPDNAHVLAASGWAHYRLGDLARAKELLTAAVDVSSRKPYQIQGLLDIVDRAIANPDADPAPAIAWLG